MRITAEGNENVMIGDCSVGKVIKECVAVE